MEMRVQNRTCNRWDKQDTSGDGREFVDRIADSGAMRRRDMGSDEEMWREGVLPPSAPLANPYVPFQRENPPTYEPRNGVVRGTLFPGLDLPYRGMINKEPLSLTHLHELQTLAFAITELGEYLDTHSNDKNAFHLYQTYVRMYKDGRARYETIHGPLTQREAGEQDSYTWLKDPWPWDYEANKEG